MLILSYKTKFVKESKIMLDEHLKAKCRPQANPENLIFWKNYRITVLSDRLFRIEKADKKIFNDRATQAVWFRDMPKNEFSVTEKRDSLTVDTGKAKLFLKEDFEKSRVILDGKAKKINKSGNLYGTHRTLDGFDGDYCRRGNMQDKVGERLTLGTGVCSKTGVAVLDDGDTLILDENGELSPREPVFDKYVFAFGKDYRAAVKAFYAIEGATPLIPRFALGNWWSRYCVYTEKSYLRLLNRFEENETPLTVASIDMDWHYSTEVDKEKHITELGRNSDFYGGADGWTGYSWNKNLFPDYKSFLKKIKAKNLKIMLNLHPAEGVRWWEDMYGDFARAMGKNPQTFEKIPFDIASDEFINNYFKIIHKPYENDGVDFWWIDWQQGTQSKKKNLDPLWSLNHYHYLDNGINHFTPLILSRYCGAGAHRYPLGFSGDTEISWNTLRYLPYFTATASNIGYSWWSHDIGGHHSGSQDEELYVRFLQFGVFNPINRLHSTLNPAVTKEPWYYKNGSGEIAVKQLVFRHKLIPFLYSAAYRTHTEGAALVEPMYYYYPEEKNAYAFKNQYMFGGELMVSPVTNKGGAEGYAAVKTWLPEGRWTDIFTGEVYRGGEVKTLLRTLDSIPVLAKEGAIIPLNDKISGNGCPLPETLRVKVFLGNGSFSLYENEDEKEAFTEFVSENKNGEQILTVRVKDEENVIPANRTLKIEFADAPEGVISANCEFEEIAADRPTCIIKSAKDGLLFVKLTYTEQTETERLIENALNVLISSNGDTTAKLRVYEKLAESKTVEDFSFAAKNCGLSATTIKKLLETV